MRRGTTPTNTFTVDIDLTQAEVIYITYKQGPRTVIEKTKQDLTITPKELSVRLTQRDTLQLKQAAVDRIINGGDLNLAEKNLFVDIQIRARFPGGDALASNIMHAPVEAILKDGEI